jgi:hypothetical protein
LLALLLACHSTCTGADTPLGMLSMHPHQPNYDFLKRFHLHIGTAKSISHALIHVSQS